MRSLGRNSRPWGSVPGWPKLERKRAVCLAARMSSGPSCRSPAFWSRMTLSYAVVYGVAASQAAR
eukprot:5047507-Alexandrium_andersonii.AAC.1